ncbi:MAG: response regulator [Alishewanella sp.]|nr:response regulator [Alishewanella sp.]
MRLEKIMHVEDDESIRMIVEMALVELSEFTLCSCERGLEALKLLGQFKPDLILLDSVMPAMDGLQTLKELRNMPNGQHIPVVFMTARIQQAEKQQYLNSGAVAVIEKPFDPSLLGDELDAIYRQFRSAN